MNEAIANLIEAIKFDYANRSWGSSDEIKNRMIEEFNKGLSFVEGSKYIKIVKDGSAWGFVVNTKEDKKFKYGDILKAAGWAAPARNQARGNVFEDYQINWTGPNYLR